MEFSNYSLKTKNLMEISSSSSPTPRYFYFFPLLTFFFLLFTQAEVMYLSYLFNSQILICYRRPIPSTEAGTQGPWYSSPLFPLEFLFLV